VYQSWIHGALASGTSVFVIAIVAFTAVIARLFLFDAAAIGTTLFPYLFWAVPGVLIGGQLGMSVARRFGQSERMKQVIGALFLGIAVLLLTTKISL